MKWFLAFGEENVMFKEISLFFGRCNLVLNILIAKIDTIFPTQTFKTPVIYPVKCAFLIVWVRETGWKKWCLLF
jgi:nuclear transport factor 2 (NTF2) superfamily protein